MPEQPAEPDQLQYPLHFDLRIIYNLAQGATLEPQLVEILQKHHIQSGLPRTLPASGSKYGKMAVAVTFQDEASMHAVYAEIGALAAVKVLL
ncbi:MAG: DUF493 domain-containing protein [Spirochaetes bacterium]|nr:DUF493 domain-containing protein [Spirochaetota bacterium]MBU0957110.1 DUF493 domain-containing protein [Spirochaetota bacterium]